MIKKKKQYVRIGLAVVIITLFWTVGTGYYRNLAAKSEETYKGLKIFSEVIELVEKNYVDPVDSKELINKAIQGMVHSLDPHSSFLPPEAFKELKMDTHGEFGGIGIVITMQKGVLTVISPIRAALMPSIMPPSTWALAPVGLTIKPQSMTATIRSILKFLPATVTSATSATQLP